MTNTSQLSVFNLLISSVVIGILLVAPHDAYAQTYTAGSCGATIVSSLNAMDCSSNYTTCAPDQLGQDRVPATRLKECPLGSGDFLLVDAIGRCVYDAGCAGLAPTATISANPTSIVRGNSSAISWTSSNTTSCTSTTFATGGATSGTIAVSPTQTTSYDVTCTGPNGSSGLKSVTVTVTAPVFDASCSVSPTSASIGQNVTWNALAWNGTTPYSFSWIGQIVQGLTGSSATVSYATAGTKTASIQVTDSTSNGTGVSLTNYDNKICTGPIIASNITPGLQEDGGTQSAMEREGYSFVHGAYYGGRDIFYNQSYSATYAAANANPQNYCIDLKLSQACNPPSNWGGCNWSFDIDIHQGTGLRDPQASDQGPFVPDTFGQWNQARFFGATLGTQATGAQVINRACINSVTVASAPAATANLSANPISIPQGGSSTLTWSSTNATSCTGTNFNTSGATSGSIAVTPAADTTYTVTCTGSGAPASSSVTVTVTAASCIWKYVDGSDITDLWGNVYTSCRLNSIQFLPDCAPGLSQASDGTNAPPGPPTACKLSNCEKLHKVGPGCAVPLTPDLTATLAQPPSAVVGTPVSLQGVVTNGGNTTTGSAFTDLFQIASDASGTGATDIGTYANGVLASGANSSVSYSYTFPSPGTWYVRVCADKSSAGNLGVITESDENNNCAGASGNSWTAISVNPAAGLGTITSCIPSPGAAPTGSPVTWTITTNGFSPAPSTVTWNAPGGTPASQSSSASTFTSSFAVAGNYSPTVTATNGAQSAGPFSCSPAGIGSVCGGSPSGAPITATPNRIRANTGTKVTFTIPTIQNVKTSCTLSGNGIPTQTFTPNACTLAPSIYTINNLTIPTQTTYTLRCDGSFTSSVNVNVLANFQEF